MKSKTSAILITGAMLSAAVLPVQADPMLDLLKVLRDKGAISAQDYNTIANAAKAKEEKTLAEKEEIVSMVQEADKKASIVTLSEKGLNFQSVDKAFTANIGGRIHTDYVNIDDEFFDRNSGADEFGNAAKFRRARIGMEGTMFTDWSYALEINYGQDESTEFTDVTIGYTGFDNVKLKLGRHKMPSGLEELTSSNRISMMERTAATNTFAKGRRNGFTAETKGSNWTLTGGVYLGEGVSKEDNEGKDTDYGYGGRFTFAPLHEKTQLVHLGVSYQREEFEKTFDGNELATNNGRLRARPGVHFFNDRPVQVRYRNTEYTDTIGLEAATVMGPLSLQGEYFRQDLSREDAKDADVDGWYAQATYTLTGESRGYRGGKMRTISPKNRLGMGGYGAWELVARYDTLDLFDSSAANELTDSIRGTEIKTLTLGVNWYVNDTIRFMANFVDAEIDSDHVSNMEGDVKAFMVRGQVAF